MGLVERFVTVRSFLRILGGVYTVAFYSFGVQAMGLIGSHGILPLGDYMRPVREGAGAAAYWELPSVLWLNWSDAAIRAIWIAGALAGLGAAAGFWQRRALAVCLVLWLSICAAGQDFLSFQWDVLLLEAGFLALFADETPIRIGLFRWLLFRLMIFSGLVKLLSGDPVWRNLTALHYHYETQPLPTPLAWYAYQLPMWFQKLSTAMVFFAEIPVPLLFFAPRRWRRIGAWITIGLQTLILLTGNYTFFNFLTIALVMFLFIEPRQKDRHRAVSIGLALFVGVVSGLLFLELASISIPGGAEILHFSAPFRIVNSYGLFAVMTTTRPEIIVEGSNDGENWSAYEFGYKAGDLNRAPPIVEPHQPRLDWQMWFAALGSPQQNRWFTNFIVRLLQGEPAVLGLIRYNPFPKGPPKLIRAQLYLYHFTTFGERGWWRREEQGPYFPPVSLR